MARARWGHRYVRIAGALLLAGIVALVIWQAVGGGDEARGVVAARGDTTTKAGVVGALESTGYELKYREVPRLEGYEIVSGEAIQGSSRVEFTVQVRPAGPFSEIEKRSEENPQPPLLRYARGLEAGETVGNIVYATMQETPAYAGHGFELKTSKAETRMSIDIGVALSELFAPRFHPGV